MIVRIVLEILPVVSRPNKRYIRVSRKKYSLNYTTFIEISQELLFSLTEIINFQFFYIFSNLAEADRSKCCRPITLARLHAFK